MKIIFENMKAPYYKRVKGVHEKNKTALIGHNLGIKDSGPFKQDKSMNKKAKSAPPSAMGGGSLEECDCENKHKGISHKDYEKKMLDEQLLSESRKSDTYAKYPHLAPYLDTLYAEDKTGLVAKYPMWIAKSLEVSSQNSSRRVPGDRIMREMPVVLTEFLTLVRRGLINADLSSYPDFWDLKAAIDAVKEGDVKKEEYNNYLKTIQQYEAL